MALFIFVANNNLVFLKQSIIYYLLIFIILFLGCTKDDPVVHYPHAATNNINDQALYQAIRKAEIDKGILSIIVYRNDDIIVEKYFNDNNSEMVHPVRSGTKSVTGILFGLAYDGGYIEDLNATVGDYLSEYITQTDTSIAQITIQNLLTMTGGFDWEELMDYENYNNWANAEDHLSYALQIPVIHLPGEYFTYTTPGCQILSAIFTKATGYNLKSFAEEFLFSQIGIIGERSWSADIHGNSFGGITLNLTAKDMLNLGILFLNNGNYNGVQVLSNEWVVESTSLYIITYNSSPYASEYGYLWWIGENEKSEYYFANGYGGQFIFIFPTLNLVVIAQSEINNQYHSPTDQWSNTISIIMVDILNSVNI